MVWPVTTQGRFAALINCMDGRIQTRAIDQVMTRFGVRWVDNITMTGAVKHLDGMVTPTGEGLLESVGVSIQAHQTAQLAIAAHADCAGNRVSDEKQKAQLRNAAVVVSARYPDLEVITLFYDPRLGFEKVH